MEKSAAFSFVPIFILAMNYQASCPEVTGVSSGASGTSSASFLPHGERMKALRELATTLIHDQSTPSDIDRLSILRKENEGLKLKLNEKELQKIS